MITLNSLRNCILYFNKRLFLSKKTFHLPTTPTTQMATTFPETKHFEMAFERKWNINNQRKETYSTNVHGTSTTNPPQSQSPSQSHPQTKPLQQQQQDQQLKQQFQQLQQQQSKQQQPSQQQAPQQLMQQQQPQSQVQSQSEQMLQQTAPARVTIVTSDATITGRKKPKKTGPPRLKDCVPPEGEEQATVLAYTPTNQLKISAAIMQDTSKSNPDNMDTSLSKQQGQQQKQLLPQQSKQQLQHQQTHEITDLDPMPILTANPPGFKLHLSSNPNDLLAKSGCTKTSPLHTTRTIQPDEKSTTEKYSTKKLTALQGFYEFMEHPLTWDRNNGFLNILLTLLILTYCFLAIVKPQNSPDGDRKK